MQELRKIVRAGVIVLAIMSNMKSFAADMGDMSPIVLKIDHIGGKVADTQTVTEGAVSITIRTNSEKK